MNKHEDVINELVEEIFDDVEIGSDFGQELSEALFDYEESFLKNKDDLDKPFNALEAVFIAAEKEEFFNAKLLPFICDHGNVLLLAMEVEAVDLANSVTEMGDDFAINTALYLSRSAAEDLDKQEEYTDKLQTLFVQSGREELLTQINTHVENAGSVSLLDALNKKVGSRLDA